MPKPYAAPLPSSGDVPWWQTWWAVLPGLLLCLPFGLVGLWRRPAVSTWLRVGLTVATAVLYGAALIPNDDPSPTASDPAPKAAATHGSKADEPTSSATPQSEAAEPEPTDDAPSEAAAAESEAAETEPVVTEPPSSVMPQVAGLTREQAEQALTDAGLVVREVREIPSAKPAGTVLRQARQAGTTVLAGTAVLLVVAAPYPQVPSVVGQAKAAAVSHLQAAGFKVTVSTEVRTSGKNGVVLHQSPAGAELAMPGSTISVVVSSIVRPVAPPVSQNCTPGYEPCLPPASDYDCAGGSGNGPEYAYGTIHVSGPDPYDLDADGDGIACTD
jgi:ribosomal protein S11